MPDSQPLSLRCATATDLECIMEMEAAGFAPGDREASSVYARRIDCFAQGSLVAYYAGEVAGCFFAEIWPAEDVLKREHFTLGHDIGARHDPCGSVLYVASMTVAPAMRGRGLGKRLFEAGIARLVSDHPQLRSVLLLVNEAWTSARTLYATAGFIEAGRLPDFFRPHVAVQQTGIIMRRRLRTAG